MASLLSQVDETAATGVDLSTWLRFEDLADLVRAAFLLSVGLALILLASHWTRRWVSERYTTHHGVIAGKLVFYPGVALIVVSVLGQLGFSLAPLLGAAGILGIALGFASQTSVSNVISGIFLLAEQPFQVDDVIQVGDTVGRVLSVDFLSVKLRTFDNRFVRIPNESIVKSQVTNITRFPIRRFDLMVGVAHKENVKRVREVLLDVARQNPVALMEPGPVVMFHGFGDSSIDLRFAVWTAKENFLKLGNSLQEEVKARFDAEGIEIPFPHRTFYTGLETQPLPIRIVASPDELPDPPIEEPGDGGGPGAEDDEDS